ncbi:hypothetical protein LguiA_028120 [Lonicera macranthoides]
MATQSAPPPTPTDDKTQNPASEVVQQTGRDLEDAKNGATKENSPTSVFVNSEPMREEQVQNAVKFLSHPKVKGSPVIYRRSFLERKGLTKEEIDEAFRRVPDPPPAVSTTQPVVTNQDGQLKSSLNNPPQVQTQVLKPAPPAPAGPVSKLGIFSPSNYHWSHAVLAIGFLAVSGAGTAIIFKNSIVPRLKSWIRKVVLEKEEEDSGKKTESKPSLAEEAAAAAKSAAAAAADVARASQDMLISKTEEKRYFGELLNMLNAQVQEMKSLSNSIRKLEGKSERVQEDRVPVTNSRPPYANGKADTEMHSARPLSPPASVETSVAPHPKSYMEIMSMVQRGEKPPNIREINDQPPNPNQPVSNPRLTPRPKPWEVSQVQNSSTNVFQSPGSVEYGFNPDFQENANQSNGDGSVTWWQQKNVRITEIETDGENRNWSSGVPINERPPAQRSWVPPQPPPVAMAEAAAAIRQPKKPVLQNEQLTDDQLLARSTEVSDELQRITKLSESGGGGLMEAGNGESPVLMNTSDIQKEGNSYSEA